ncbi:MAG: hypothetical protein LBN05_07655 [Oscillospiraceae bacterium]|jgi:hypothetical protein|nr:hypothetical protein [Oscillospiraceae bacterium]
MFSKNKRIKKLISMIMVIAMIFSAIGAMSLSAFAATGSANYMLGSCIDDSVVKFGYNYWANEATILDYKDHCFIRYADSKGWGQWDKLTESDNLKISVGGSIGAKNDTWAGQVTGSMEKAKTFTSEMTRSPDVPSGKVWRVARVGRVYLVSVKYTFFSNNTTWSETHKLYVYPPEETAIIKVYKVGTTGNSPVQFTKDGTINQTVYYAKDISNPSKISAAAYTDTVTDKVPFENVK